MIQRRLRIGYNRTTRMSNQDPFSSYTGDLFGSHFTFCSPSKPLCGTMESLLAATPSDKGRLLQLRRWKSYANFTNHRHVTRNLTRCHFSSLYR